MTKDPNSSYRVYGKLVSVHNGSVTLRLSDGDLQRFSRYAGHGHPVVELRVDDGRRITSAQRQKAYALLGDISRNSGYTKDQAKDITKRGYRDLTGVRAFSLSDTAESNASHYIDYLIDVVFRMDWNLSKRTYRLVKRDGRFQKDCAKNPFMTLIN